MSSISNSVLFAEHPNILFALLTMCILLMVFSLWMYNQTAPLIEEYKNNRKEGVGAMFIGDGRTQGFFGGMEAPVTNEYNRELAQATENTGRYLSSGVKAVGKYNGSDRYAYTGDGVYNKANSFEKEAFKQPNIFGQ